MNNIAQQLLLNVTVAHIKHYYYITYLRIFNNDNLFLPSIKIYQQSCKNNYETTRFFELRHNFNPPPHSIQLPQTVVQRQQSGFVCHLWATEHSHRAGPATN
jgi:hypothetical protein